MSNQYSITFVNNSTNSGNVCVFQEAPKVSNQEVLSLAWFSKMMHPNTKVVFEWEVDYSFVWSETGRLTPGVQFIASEVLPAGLNGNNAVTLAYADRTYQFINQTTQGNPGSLYIDQASNIPLKKASVGVGMSGSASFAVQAEPNKTLIFNNVNPRYYIAFGNFIQGEVLDTSIMRDAQEIRFDPRVYSITAILNGDNSWTIRQD